MAFNGDFNPKTHSSSLQAIHCAVELRRSRASLSTIVVFCRGSIGPATRHRVIALHRSPHRCRCRCIRVLCHRRHACCGHRVAHRPATSDVARALKRPPPSVATTLALSSRRLRLLYQDHTAAAIVCEQLLLEPLVRVQLAGAEPLLILCVSGSLSLPHRYRTRLRLDVRRPRPGAPRELADNQHGIKANGSIEKKSLG
ncbi:hypothetical protein Syun_020777 [Stephania yunnanensis]|uniref:Uncharacterized protein n=1 Tax=Stephania yunnanensis TaxID=152371 RepID=A0AAP0NQB9_9MAGN